MFPLFAQYYLKTDNVYYIMSYKGNIMQDRWHICRTMSICPYEILLPECTKFIQRIEIENI